MFTLWGSKQSFCDGISRRNFLRIGAFGAGLTLADMLRLRSSAATSGPAVRKTVKSAIMIFLAGGPPHLDMYDLKPEAPAEIRGEFKPIATNVTGVRICELFPLQAKMWDKLACIRSVVGTNNHSDTGLLTGYSEEENRTANHPGFGSVVSKLRPGDGSVPPFVSLYGERLGNVPGYLGKAHSPFTPNGPGLSNLTLRGISQTRLDDRKQLLQDFDHFRRDIDTTGTMAGLDDLTTRAFAMIASGAVHNALDLKREDSRTRDRYKGIEDFLTARRLVEAGVGCVTMQYGSWDFHGGEFGERSHNFKGCRKQMPDVDRGVTNLIQDLHDRGMENDVVTVMWGEFGRAPKITPTGGRDHWTPVMSALVAGGGLKMGQVVGSSTERGERPRDRPYTVQQVLSTVYQTIGIDPSRTFPSGSGRPMYILDDREPVTELI